MRALVQRVTEAGVSIEGAEVGRIGAGLCAFVGVTHDDDEAAATRLAGKIWGLRIMADAAGVMSLSVGDTTGEVLVISQFTLYADTRKGRRPGWSAAANPAHAEPLVDAVVGELRRLGGRVATGRFGADMRVGLVNDGPVTILLEV